MSETAGGDFTQEVCCPLCGEQVYNNSWPDHLTECPGGDQV